MPLRGFGECFELYVSKEVMPYNISLYIYIYIYIYTYEHVSNGSASIQSALGILNDSGKQQLLNNVEQWNCGMANQMLDLIEYSSYYCQLDGKVLMDGYGVFRSWMLEHTGLYIDH